MVDTAKLKEALRQQERVLDHAIRTTENEGKKIEVLLGVALLILGWAVPVLSVMVDADPGLMAWTRWTFAIASVTGTALLVAAVLFLVVRYIGTSRNHEPTYHVGPNAGRMTAVAEDDTVTYASLLIGLTRRLPTYIRDVDGETRRARSIRRRSVLLVVSGLLSYATAGFMLMGVL